MGSNKEIVSASTETGAKEMWKIDSFAEKILKQFYSRKDYSGKPIESATDVLNRVWHALCDDTDEEFRKRMQEKLANFEIVPSSPILMNAGTDLGQLSACFVLPINDSLSEIYDAVKEAALVHKSGGGTGFSFSRIRSQGCAVHSTGGIASGPLSFMSVFNASTDTIKQGGKRRGANMGCLAVWHPDIEAFIKCKLDDTSFTNFNLSVGITQKFIDAVEGQGDITSDMLNEMRDKVAPEDKDCPPQFLFGLKNPSAVKSANDAGIKKIVDARRIWHLIADCAWKHGDPGLLFLDTINRCTPTKEEIESTNPCGEIPLLPYESCNLSAINLTKCVDENGQFDFFRLRENTAFAVRFLNKVLDCNKLPLPAIEKQTLKYRKIGVGIMGFGDLCYMLGIRYGSDRCVELATQITKCMAAQAKITSAGMYKELKDLKVPIKGFCETDMSKEIRKAEKEANKIYRQDESCHVKMIDDLWQQARRDCGNGVLNLCRLTAAPTGTTGILAGVSGGIEPNFSLVYTRYVNGTDAYLVSNPVFEKYCRDHGYTNADIKRFTEDLHKHKSIRNCSWATTEMKDIFVCTDDIPWQDHIRVMHAFQRYIDNSVSKTINLPNDASVDDVLKIYEMACDMKLKGITIYRDKCRENQVLNSGTDNESEVNSDSEGCKDSGSCSSCNGSKSEKCSGSECNECNGCNEVYTPINHRHDVLPRPRARIMKGVTPIIKTGCGKLYITVNSDESGIAEVFTGAGNGGCEAQSAALSRVVSVALRSGVDPEELIDQLSAVTCKAAERNNNSECKSCPDAIARALRMVLAPEQGLQLLQKKQVKEVCQVVPHTVEIDVAEIDRDNDDYVLCPRCNQKVIHECGCVTCPSCGWSKCR